MQLRTRLTNLVRGHAQHYTGESKILRAIYVQIWDLLPSYCKSPLDLCQSFKYIAKFLGSALIDCPLQRLVILQCLRTLVLSAKKKEEKTELSQKAPKNLPILFNIFLSDLTSSEEVLGYDVKGVRQATLETIRIYLSITSESFLNQYL